MADTSIPYNALIKCTYKILVLPSCTLYFSYTGSISHNKSTSGPLIFMMVRCPSLSRSSRSVWTNALGISHVATSLLSIASITPVIRVASVLTVGLETSSLLIHTLCVLPFTHVRPFNALLDFSTMKNNDSIARFLSVGLSVLWSIGFQQFLSWSCLISFNAASLAGFSPNFVLALLRL